MRMTSRVARLERAFAPVAPPGPCWWCERIDADTGLTLFFGGVRLSEDDGTHTCFCKTCGRGFRGRLTVVNTGKTLVSDMVPAAFPA